MLTRRPLVTAAYILAAGYVVALLASAVFRIAYTDEQIEFGTDYATFHSAALLVTDGDGSQMYDADVLVERIIEATGYTERKSVGFGHFPFFALLFVPLTLLPFPAAYMLFLLISFGALGATLARVGVRPIGSVLGLVAISMSGFWTIQLGQMGLLVSALLVGVFLALRSDRPFRAGLLLGLLIFKPTYAVGVGIWWLLRAVRFRMAIVGAVASMVAVSLAGLAIPGAWESYRGLMSEGLVVEDVTTSGYSLFEMWFTMLSSGRVAAALWLSSAAMLLAAFVVVIRRLDHRLEPSLALAVILGLIVSPRTGWYDWVLLVVPAALLWHTYPRLRSKLVVAGAWLFPAAAFSWPLAKRLDEASGFFLQLAPLVLVGVAWWFVRLLLAEEERTGVGNPSVSTSKTRTL